MLSKHAHKPHCLLALALAVLFSLAAVAQEASPSQPIVQGPQRRPDEVTYDFQVDLLLASSDTAGRAALPRSLEAVAPKLKEIFPGYGYRLAGTFFGRASDGLNIKGVSTLDLGPPMDAAAPFFYDLSLIGVQPDIADSQRSVRIQKLRYDLRVPIARVPTRTDGGGSTNLLVDYQGTGLTTTVSAREGAPTLVGSMNVGRKDQILLLILTARRSM